MRTINRIAIHHAAAPITTTVEDITRWHTDKGWSDVGYHYLIDYDGRIHEGRPVEKVGSHVRGWNKDSIGICLIMDSNKTPMSEAMEESLGALLDHLMDLYDLDREDVATHQMFKGANTECPGAYVQGWWEAWISEGA